MLSDFCNSKELWSDRCGSAGCDASTERSFGVSYKERYVIVPDIYLRSLGLTLYFPKDMRSLTKE